MAFFLFFTSLDVGCVQQTGGHYPAPVAILDAIKYGFDHKKPEVRDT